MKEPVVGELTVRDENAVVPNVTQVGLREGAGSDGAEAERHTVPLKLPRLVSRIVEVDDDPTGIVRVLGLAERSKSNTATTMVSGTEWVSEPLVPVTVTT